MGIIQKTDEWLMSEVFEPLAWRIEYRYDVCHVDVAGICFFLCVASLGLFGLVSGNLPAFMASSPFLASTASVSSPPAATVAVGTTACVPGSVDTGTWVTNTVDTVPSTRIAMIE